MKNFFKKFFLPHEDNNNHPHFWRKESVLILLAFILLTEFGLIAQSFFILKKDSFTAAVFPGVLVSLTNDYRVGNNLPTLKTNSLLEEAALLKAKDMAEKGYFAHVTPDGKTPWYWLSKVGYKYKHAGENLAVDFYDSKDVVNAWIKSPTHKANLLKNTYTEIGIATAEGTLEGKKVTFAVQFFGMPNQEIIPTKIQKPNNVIDVSAKPVSEKNIDKNIERKAIVAGAESPVEVSLIDKVATSPRHTESSLLFTLIGIIVVAILVAVLGTGHTRHPKILITGIFLIAIIVGVIVLNNYLLVGGIQI